MLHTVFDRFLTVNPSHDRPKVVNHKPMDFILGEEYRSKIVQIRECKDKDEQKRLKEQLPLIIPTGLFSKREEKGIFEANGFFVFDVDAKDNPDLISFNTFKRICPGLPWIAFAQESCRGKGFWGLIYIHVGDCKTTQQLKERYYAYHEKVESIFKAMGIQIDDCHKSYAQGRYISWSESPYINENTQVLPIPEPKPKQLQKPKQIYNVAFKPKSENWLLNKIEKDIAEAPEHEKHYHLRRIAYRTGGYVGGGQLDEQTAYDTLYNAIMQRNIRSEINAVKTIVSGLKKGALEPIFPQVRKAPTESTNEPQPKPIQDFISDFESEKYTIQTFTSLLTGEVFKLEINQNRYPADWDDLTPLPEYEQRKQQFANHSLAVIL